MSRMAREERGGSGALPTAVRLEPNIGARIEGVDLGERLDDAAQRSIRSALVEHEVLVFRGQDITTGQHVEFARGFGEPTVHPFSPNLAERPEVIVLDYTADNPPALTDVWHSDETFRAEPPMATLLRATVVPEIGGDTVFASMSAAHDGLSDRMQSHLSGLVAVHDFKPFRALFGDDPAGRQRLRDMEERFPNPAHPVVRVHPESGRKVLFVNPQFTVRIDGMREEESRSLLDFLFRQASVPEYQVRVQWEPNTLVFWDNRSVQHYAVHDYHPQRRRMERVTLGGDRPLGVGEPLAPVYARPLPRYRGPGRDPAAPVRQFERD